MKYLVMECHLSYAVVLDEEGRFLKAANRQYRVGQTVTEIIEMEAPPPAKNGKRWIYSLTALAACLMVMVTAVFQVAQAPFASVYMSINPEVRIDVNRRDVVVGLEGVNADGQALTQGYDFRKKDLDLVMDELVDRAIDMGYLHEGGQIALTLDADSQEWVVTHSETLSAHLSQHLSGKLSATILVNGQTAQPTQVVIPVAPEESDYGMSDYGQTPPVTRPSEEGEDSDYEDREESDDLDDSPYEEEGGQTDYEEPDDSGYEEDEDDRDSDYEEDD